MKALIETWKSSARNLMTQAAKFVGQPKIKEKLERRASDFDQMATKAESKAERLSKLEAQFVALSKTQSLDEFYQVTAANLITKLSVSGDNDNQIHLLRTKGLHDNEKVEALTDAVLNLQPKFGVPALGNSSGSPSQAGASMQAAPVIAQKPAAGATVHAPAQPAAAAVLASPAVGSISRSLIATAGEIRDPAKRSEFVRNNADGLKAERAGVRPLAASAPTPANTKFGPGPGEPSLEVLEAVRTMAVGDNPAESYDRIFFGWNGSPGQPTASQLNYELARDAIYKAHLEVPGLSLANSAARVKREPFPQLKRDIEKVDGCNAMIKGFIAELNGQDTTGREFSGNFIRAGVAAAKVFKARREREARQLSARMAEARSKRESLEVKVSSLRGEEQQLAELLAGFNWK